MPIAPAAPHRLAFVLLREAVVVDRDAVLRAYAALAPDGAALAVASGDALVFEMGGALVALSVVAAPVPGGEAEAMARFSVDALGERWTPPAHAAHVIVFAAPGQATPRERARDFHRVVAAIAIAVESAAVGVYLGGVATHRPAFFVAAARASADPIAVWCGVDAIRDGAEVRLLSRGMPLFGLPDVLLTAPLSAGARSLGHLLDLLQMIIEYGEHCPRATPWDAPRTSGSRSATSRLRSIRRRT